MDSFSRMELGETSAISEDKKYTVQLVTKFTCKYCAMQFASLRDMQLHVLSHTHGKTLHSCTVCGRSYTTPSKLQRHVRVHSGERPYMCNLCGRRFTRSDHVKQHMKVHQPHRQKNMCRICGVRFARSSLLGSHLRRHSILLIHVCRRCGEGFQEAEELDLHRKLHKIKSNLRPNGRRRSRGAPVDMSALTSGPPDDINPKIPSEGKWVGCARFCVAQVSTSNSKIIRMSASENEDHDGDEASNKNEIEFIKQEVQYPSMESEEQQFLSSERSNYQMSISTSYTLAKSLVDNQFRRFSAESEKMVILPSSTEANQGISLRKSESVNNQFGGAVVPTEPSSCPEMLRNSLSSPEISRQTLSSPEISQQRLPSPEVSHETLSALRAVIKREPGCAKEQDSQYPVSLLARNSVAMSQCPPFMKYPEDLSQQTQIRQRNISSPASVNGKRLSKCDHCGMWFEDFGIYMLHSSLHSADETDPFTCRKCLKKLGNRLEFMAHLVWHLDPELHI
ncbi:zinc finger protein ztf-16-like isoform X2 [Octopus sinensis]|uniref:Zinc finger protein ztf-16-like isoform X2 n=1 Tax=Octopus sinensis TaxID=2607531 RepID=A0A7E6F4G5_9MOLL|nr:zinc finger protein ztf-16-like isoform X2 [Octopus sinensis]